MNMKKIVILTLVLLMHIAAVAQAPGTTPVKISYKTQMLNGRKYYIHIVEKGQTVYSISKAYKVESYDAVTHVDIHFLHPGDTVWLPCRGQFSNAAEENETVQPTQPAAQPSQPAQPSAQPVAPKPEEKRPTPTPVEKESPAKPLLTVVQQAPAPRTTPPVRKLGTTLKVSLMMPLHLDQLDEISTSKFDIEQRGKKSYKQFEFIEFYEGVLLALDKLAERGMSVELNVVDVSDNSPAKVEEAFASHHVGESDFVVALLFRDAFDRAAQLAQAAGVYIVNPMATRSEICATNPYMVKIQPSVAGMVELMLNNMKLERPNGHLYVIHSNAKAEKPVLDELKRQLDERKDIRYTIFNWTQSAKLTNVMKATPDCNVVSIYDQSKDNNRLFVGNILNKLSAFKTRTPMLYSLTDWTTQYMDLDFAQLQLLNYHTFSTSWDMTNEVHVQFLKDFRSRFGSEPTTSLASTGYDLMVYLVAGLSHRGTEFWSNPTRSLPAMTHPIQLQHSGEGLENASAQLYRLEDFRFVPAPVK